MAYIDNFGVEFSDDRTVLTYCPVDIQGTYVIPDGVEIIDDEAFEYCDSLIGIILPDSIKSIGENAFYGCSSIISIAIPDSVNSVGKDAFDGIPNIEYHGDCLGSPWGAKCVNGYIEDCLVYRDTSKKNICACYSNAKEIVVPQGVETIELSAFSECKNLRTITYPDSIQNLAGGRSSWLAGLAYKGLCVESIYIPQGQKQRFIQMGLENYSDRLIEYENECNIYTRVHQMKKYLFFDTECNGLPINYNAPISATSNWPRLIQLAWIVTDEKGSELKRQSHIIYPNGFTIESEVTNLTSISIKRAQCEGIDLKDALQEFMEDVEQAEILIGHNVDFDRYIIGCELYRTLGAYNTLLNKSHECTMRASTDYCAIPSDSPYGEYKWPKLEELYLKLFGCMFDNAHDALADVEATKKCYFELIKQNVI